MNIRQDDIRTGDRVSWMIIDWDVPCSREYFGEVVSIYQDWRVLPNKAKGHYYQIIQIRNIRTGFLTEIIGTKVNLRSIHFKIIAREIKLAA